MLQVLAYGQTGSGKTYSMGSTADPQQLNGRSKPYGVIPRALVTLFEGLQQLQPDYEVASKVRTNLKAQKALLQTQGTDSLVRKRCLPGCLLSFSKIACMLTVCSAEFSSLSDSTISRSGRQLQSQGFCRIRSAQHQLSNCGCRGSMQRTCY